MAKKRIGILGIGAVGGYFGGLLAEKYYQSENIEIIFFSRPASEKVIRKSGLKLITPDQEKYIFPAMVTSNASGVDAIDFLICAVKSYDLEESLLALKNCIHENTLILPLLNGVDASERIKKLYPKSVVLEGCVYLMCRLIEPGIVKALANTHKMYFGSDKANLTVLKEYENNFIAAGIDCQVPDDIQLATWEKFIFIAGLANATSYLDLSIGKVMRDHRPFVTDILGEVKQIADARKIKFPDNIIEKTLSKMESLPFDGTSSMHSDFKKGGKAEYHSITGYLVLEGDRLKIDTPLLDKILKKFEGG